MSLQSLKKSNTLDKLLGAAEVENKPQEKKSYVDERIWKPVMDKSGNGFAVIRFLPAAKVKTYLGQRFGTMRFKGQLVNGILRTLSLHLVRMILYLR